MKNEIGNKYGSWTVLSLDEQRSHDKKRYWICQCVCGKKKSLGETYLHSGRIGSCGCQKEKKNYGKNGKNELGKKYGKLTVIAKSDNLKNNHLSWICQCDCGNILEVSGAQLRNGSRTCCNQCISQNAIVNEVGNHYGDLTVLEYVGQDKNRKALWKCKCSCGNEIIWPGTELRNNNKLNCGCKRVVSKGNLKIKDILIKNNILFTEEQKFENCLFPDTNYHAYFDFYLPSYNTLIEYDGMQHYFYNNFKWCTEENYKKVQQHDKFKNEWCKEQNINLIRIPYTHFPDIMLEDLLPNSSSFLVKE